MAYMTRWVICPLIFFPGPPPKRVPKVSLIEDPGRDPVAIVDEDGIPTGEFFQPTFSHSSAWSAVVNDSHCLSHVVGISFAPLDLDREVIDLFESDHQPLDRLAVISQTMRQRGKQGSDETRVKAEMVKRDIDVRNVSLDTPLRDILNLIGKRFQPGYECEAIIMENSHGPWANG